MRRDPQREKVYDAEDEAIDLIRPSALSLRDAQRFVNWVIEGDVFPTASSGRGAVVVQEHPRLYAETDKSGQFIKIHHRHLNEMVILHEMGHVAMIRSRNRSRRWQDHGPEFVGITQEMYRDHLPAEWFLAWRNAAVTRGLTSNLVWLAPAK